jgi:hypothetical protein
MDTNFDFVGYVAARKAGPTGVRGEGYAFEGDLKVLRAMRQAHTVERLMARFVRLNKRVLTGQLLGSAVKVGPAAVSAHPPHRATSCAGHPRHPGPAGVPRGQHRQHQRR